VTGLETASFAFTLPAQLADVIKISKVHWFNYEVGDEAGKAVSHPRRSLDALSLDCSEPWRKVLIFAKPQG
jgi:hypothetical protein